MNPLNSLIGTPLSKLGKSLLVIVALTLSACGGGGGGSDPAPTPPPAVTLTSIAITPSSAVTQTGSTVNFTAQGTYSDSSTADITSQVTWTSNNTAVTISSAGLATAGTVAGPTLIGITATLSGKSANAAILVTSSALTALDITPLAPASVPKGIQVPFTATGTFADTTTADMSNFVTWASDNAAVTLDSTGLASTPAIGTANISCSLGAINSTAPAALTVTAAELASLTVSPDPAYIVVNQTKQFTVTGTMTDGSAANLTAGGLGLVNWVSSNTGAANVDVNGLVTAGAGAGFTNLTADHAGYGGLITSNIVLVTVDLTIQMGGGRQGASLPLTTQVSSLAGSPTQAAGFVDNIGTAATFFSPAGITTDGLNIYVADLGNNAIRQVTPAGAVTTLAGAGPGFNGWNDATGASATFNYPEGITTDGTNLYVADTWNHRIRKVTYAGVVSTFAGSGTISTTDGVGAAAAFNYPRGITTDGINLYVADSSNNRIRVIDIATGTVSTMAAVLNDPRGITTDGTNLYVACNGDHTIRQIVIASGTLTTLAGMAGMPGSADNTGTAASFRNPQGITSDGTNLYVSDTENHTIRKIVIATGVVTTLAGTAGTFGATDALTGTAATFRRPVGITSDGNKLYVSDNSNNKIRQIQ